MCKKKLTELGKLHLKGGHPGSEGQATWFLSCAKVSCAPYMYQGGRKRTEKVREPMREEKIN